MRLNKTKWRFSENQDDLAFAFIIKVLHGQKVPPGIAGPCRIALSDPQKRKRGQPRPKAQTDSLPFSQCMDGNQGRVGFLLMGVYFSKTLHLYGCRIQVGPGQSEDA